MNQKHEGFMIQSQRNFLSARMLFLKKKKVGIGGDLLKK